jgi:hypothetical protein
MSGILAQPTKQNPAVFLNGAAGVKRSGPCADHHVKSIHFREKIRDSIVRIGPIGIGYNDAIVLGG